MLKKQLLPLIFFAILLVGCASKVALVSTETPTVPQTPTPASLLYKDPSQPVDVRVKDLLARMTLDEKISQMVQPIQNSTPAGDVEAYSLGSVLSTAEGISDTNSLADWTRIPGTYLKAALETRLGIPLLYGVDSVHGFGHVNGATIFPHNIGLGATRDPDLLKRSAVRWRRRCAPPASLGVLDRWWPCRKISAGGAPMKVLVKTLPW